ncbi:hypothetical protein LTR64_001234 [Lithohypha guttulata]|uniref:uncharacterized protein n=1 Tax=Lithohypha guttulata TaxID=1690604 RepID=UPI002DDDD16E|nr:hypothetical protein LTR51_003428 [Lithohypha guttulata]
MFLTQVAVPSSMQMSAATKRTGGTFGSTDSSCYNIAFNTATTFATTCSGCGKTQRQAAAFEQLTGDGSDNGDIMDILPCLDWLHLNDVTIVEVNARSTATADSLSSLLPSLSFIVQYHEPEDTGLSRIRPQRSLSAAPLPHQPLSSTGSHPRVSIQYRTPGTPQIVEGAAVYIIHLPQASLSRPVQSVINESVVELKAHFAALRAHPNSVVILVARVLPEPGTVNSDVERAARLRNLSMHQIAKVQDPGVHDITEVLNKASDGSFRLFLVNKYISRKSSVMAFEARCWAL